MSETSTPPTYTVTLSSGAAGAEGTLDWALTQANAYTGEGVPTIAFAANLSGCDVSLNGSYVQVMRDMSFVSVAEGEVKVEGVSVAAGACLTLGRGVTLGGWYKSVAGTLVCQSGSALADETTICSGGVLKLNDVRVGRLTLEEGGHIEGSGVTFGGYSSLELSAWSGSTASAFSKLSNVTAEDGALSVRVYAAGDCTLASIPGIEVEYLLDASSCPESTTTLESGATLSGWSVYNTLVCNPGSVLDGGISVNSGGVLKLNGAHVKGEVFLRKGARVEGDGNVFDSPCPIRLDVGVSWADALAGLSGSRYTAENVYVDLNVTSIISGDATLAALPAPFLGYWMGNSSSVRVEGTLTIDKGVNLYTEKGGGCHFYGSVTFAGQNHVYAERSYDLYYGAYSFPGIDFNPYQASSAETAVVDLADCTLHGTVEVAAGVELRGNGACFMEEQALVLYVENWDGVSVPSSIASLQNSHFVSGAYTTVMLKGLGGRSLSWDDADMLPLLTPDGCPELRVGYLVLNEGDALYLEPNSSWENRPVIVGQGATLTCGKGCRMVSGILGVEDEGYTEYNPALVVKSGGTLVANGLTVSGTLLLEPGATLQGSIHFAKGSRISLRAMEGNTADLLETLLEGVTWTSDEPLMVEIGAWCQVLSGADSYDNQKAMTGAVELAKLDGRFGDYVVPGDCSGFNYPLTVQKGVNVLVESDFYGYDGGVIFEGDNVVRAGTPCATLGGDSIVAHGTRFEVSVSFRESFVGENVTFAAKVPFCVTEKYGTTVWDGSAAALQTLVDEFLKDVSGYTIEAESPHLGVDVQLQSADLIISPETKAAMVPAGFDGLYFESLCIENGRSVTVEAGGLLDADYIDIEDNASLVIKPGATLMNSMPDGISIYVRADSDTCGSLAMDGVELNDVEIYAHGNLDLRNCWGKGELSLSATYQHGSVRVTGCDLSQVDISLRADEYGEFSSSVVFDFSGNYWGTTDVEAIKAKIAGYSDSHVVLGDILSSAPAGLLFEPTSLQVEQSGKLALFSWGVSAGRDVTYDLAYKIAGSSSFTYSTGLTSTSKSLALPTGTYTWAVRAKDAQGHTSDWVWGENLSMDATAPSMPTSPQVKVSGTNATLSWGASSDASGVTYELAYKLSSASGFTYATLSGTSKTLSLPAGTYKWAVRAKDSYGNTTGWVWGSDFRAEMTAPSKPTSLSVKQVAGDAVFSWGASSGSGVTYDLAYKIAGSSSFSYRTGLTGTSKAVSLPTGTYTWAVRAKDAHGNTTDWAWGSNFTKDSSAPTNPSSLQVKVSGTNATFTWGASSDASGVTYELAYKLTTASGYSYTTLSGTSKTLTLPAGTYKWAVRAKDRHGNTTSWAWGSDFSTGAPAKPTFLSVKQVAGDAVFSWSSSTGAVTYDLAYKIAGSSAFSYRTGLTGTSKVVNLPTGTYTWAVRAKDAHGNTAGWVWGTDFTKDSSAPTNPSSLQVKVSGVNATFSWGASSDASGVTYELAYKLTTASGYTYTPLTGTSKTLSLSNGTYKWAVRAKDRYGNTTGWVWGSDFSAGVTKPTSLSVKQVAGDAVFSWAASSGSGVTYDLAYKITGSSSFSYRTGLTTTSKAVNLPTGTYTWAVRAKDSQGNTTDWAWGATLNKDSTAPTKPSSLQVTVSGTNATFTWGASTDASGLTYDLAYKLTTASSYTICSMLTSTRMTMGLPTGAYSWAVRANDSYGNTTGWVWGQSFSNATARSSAQTTGLDQELALSAGVSSLSGSVSQPVALAASPLELGAQKDASQTMAQSLLA